MVSWNNGERARGGCCGTRGSLDLHVVSAARWRVGVGHTCQGNVLGGGIKQLHEVGVVREWMPHFGASHGTPVLRLESVRPRQDTNHCKILQRNGKTTWRQQQCARVSLANVGKTPPKRSSVWSVHSDESKGLLGVFLTSPAVPGPVYSLLPPDPFNHESGMRFLVQDPPCGE